MQTYSMKRRPITHPKTAIAFDTEAPAPMKRSFLTTYYENDGNYGIGSTHGNQYDYMQAKDPCADCHQKAYCAEARGICLGFTQYVETGKYEDKNVGKPVIGGYTSMLKDKGQWKKYLFANS